MSNIFGTVLIEYPFAGEAGDDAIQE
jgi:hypothetical protein